VTFSFIERAKATSTGGTFVEAAVRAGKFQVVIEKSSTFETLKA
jgi:hypothetical protein